MKRDFDAWINTFKDTIATWRYYVDFKKIYCNIESVKVELNLLNSLINSKNIEKEFESIVSNYPRVLKVIPILLAKRESEIRIIDAEGDFCFNFRNPNYDIKTYVKFMRETGLFDLLENHIISDLVDYVKGVEVGMDTNARKNRTGHSMEDLLEGYIIKAGFVKDVTYFKEMNKSKIEAEFGLDLSKISNKGKAEKRFDFVVKKDSCIYAIETNFYSGGGSKLNETARSYKMLAMESKGIAGFKFVWITDGIGWHSAKRNLKETFDCMEELYNIADLENGAINKLK